MPKVNRQMDMTITLEVRLLNINRPPVSRAEQLRQEIWQLRSTDHVYAFSSELPHLFDDTRKSTCWSRQTFTNKLPVTVLGFPFKRLIFLREVSLFEGDDFTGTSDTDYARRIFYYHPILVGHRVLVKPAQVAYLCHRTGIFEEVLEVG